jgi:hypothetical protein
MLSYFQKKISTHFRPVFYQQSWFIFKQTLAIFTFFSILLLCACAASENPQKSLAQSPLLNKEQPTSPIGQQKAEQGNSLLAIDIKQLYESATSWQEKREICIKAIDSGVLYRAGPVSVLDTIFGTSLSSPVAGKVHKVRWSKIYFEPKSNGSEQSHKKKHDSNQASPIWALLVEHDRDVILRYRITTVEKR